MLKNIYYRVLLPDWVFEVNNEDELIENAKKHMKICYPERRLIEIDGRFAVCERVM